MAIINLSVHQFEEILGKKFLVGGFEPPIS